jgi:hypothetical protein
MGKEKKQGISYMTAWRWFRDGRLPVRAEQMATGTVIVHDEEAPAVAAVALYARVLSHEQKASSRPCSGVLSEYALARKTDRVALCRRNRVGLEWPSPKTHEVAEKQGRLGNRRRASGPSLSVSALNMLNARLPRPAAGSS